MGRQIQELWIEYYLHLPSNFALRNEAPANNKVLALWTDTYSDTNNVQVVLEYERNGVDSSYARSIVISSAGQPSNQGDRFRSESFFTAAKGGAWYRMRMHFRCASAGGTTDGVFEAMMGDELVWRSRTDYQFFPSGGSTVNYVRNGYLLGYANSGFTDQTDFHIRAVKCYDQNPGWVFA